MPVPRGHGDDQDGATDGISPRILILRSESIRTGREDITLGSAVRCARARIVATIAPEDASNKSNGALRTVETPVPRLKVMFVYAHAGNP